MESSLLGLVLDTSSIIEAERKREPVVSFLRSLREQFGPVEICMSAITLAELVHAIERATSEEIKVRRRSFIDEIKRHVPVVPVTEEMAERAGVISGRSARVGLKIPMEDLLIGVAALQQGYAVLTLNRGHFDRIPELRVLERVN